MWLMPGRERDSWPWAVAPAICAVLLPVVLGAKGLGAAANLVQVLSVVFLVGGLAATPRLTSLRAK